jgi:hypothetical protein
LIDAVLGEINRRIRLFKVNLYKRDEKTIRRLKKQLADYEKRDVELKEIVKQLIEKSAQGILNSITFEELMNEYQIERVVVEKGILSKRAEIAADPKIVAQRFSDELKKYPRPLKVLSRDIVIDLIESIVVHESECPKGTRVGRKQYIEVHFKHIGMIGDPIMVGDVV